LNEKIASVSCGNTTTIVCTEITQEMVGEDGAKVRQFVGGKVYTAGSRNVLGDQCDVFKEVKENIAGVAIKQISAGYQHSAIVSAEGELYCWGFNNDEFHWEGCWRICI
jgi:hypothetical protein